MLCNSINAVRGQMFAQLFINKTNNNTINNSLYNPMTYLSSLTLQLYSAPKKYNVAFV